MARRTASIHNFPDDLVGKLSDRSYSVLQVLYAGLKL